MERSDVLVIGGGIAGASAAYFLAEAGLSAIVLERETAPGYHTSGRSAAQFAESYEPPIARRLAVASRTFFHAPPAGFAEGGLVSPRGSLVIARRGQENALAEEVALGNDVGTTQHLLDPDAVRRLVPAITMPDLAGGVLEPGAQDIDVGALLGGYLRGAKARGARLVTDAEVTALERIAGSWRATTRAGIFAAPIVVDAAGSWADEVARMAGVAPLGLTPKRRTAFVFDPPREFDSSRWPLTGDLDNTWYIKPEPGRIMGSLSDETPSPPCDAQPEDIDVAQAIANIEEATSLRIGRPLRRWAGLRTFTPDHQPVNGFDPVTEGFYWLAGQGGYGMLTSPAMGRAAAALIAGRDLPRSLQDAGLAARDLSPSRLGAGR